MFPRRPQTVQYTIVCKFCIELSYRPPTRLRLQEYLISIKYVSRNELTDIRVMHYLACAPCPYLLQKYRIL